MGDPGEPADGTTSSEGEGQGEVEDVAAEQGQADDSPGPSGAPAAPDSGPAAETAAVQGFWWRRRRVVLGLGAATVVAIVIVAGGVAAGSGSGDDRSSPPGDTTRSTPASTTTTTTETTTTSTTTSTSTTTTTTPPPTEPAPPPVAEPNHEPAGEPATDDGVMTPITEPSHTVPVCGLGPWGESQSLGTVPGPPEEAKLISGPSWNCANAATGCRVSISTTWSDGVTASDSRTLTAPGTYTLNDGRGTTASFSVTPDLICVFNSADYSNTWPSDF